MKAYSKENCLKGFFPIFSGPCVIESEDSALFHAEKLKKIFESQDLDFVYKSSFDKANRTSLDSYRGPGLDEGLKILEKIKKEFSLQIITDFHLPEQASVVSEVADVIQIPAFLCRQTDMLVAAAKTKKPVLIKKGQFLAPEDMTYVAEKVKNISDSSQIMLAERGSSFGYRNIVVDFVGVSKLQSLGYPVIFDATHSVQVIGGQGGKSGGNREAVSSLVRAAVAFGVDGLFLETHENPEKALSDGPNMVFLDKLSSLLEDVKKLLNLRSS